jgi:hypothetical protein
MAMTELVHAHLMTLSLDVAFGAMLTIGATPAGLRRIAPVTGGTFDGPRLKGIVRPGGADWVINRPDGVMVIDVRLVLETDDGALVYLTYQGRFLAEPDAMARFGRGGLLAPGEYSLAIHARLECGDTRHAWLNDLVIVGTGRQTRAGPIYDLFAIG